MNNVHLLRLFILVLFLSIFGQVFGQQQNDGRVEIEVNSFSDAYFLLPVGQQGLLLFGQANKIERGKLFFDFTKYDTQFKKDWTVEIELDRRLQYQKHYFDRQQGKLYVLMARSKGQLLIDIFTVICLDLETSQLKSLHGTINSYIHVVDFMANGGTVFIGGHLYPSKSELFLRSAGTLAGLYIPAIFGSLRYKLDPMLIAADFENMTMNNILGNTKHNTRVLSLSLDTNYSLISAFVSEKKSRHETSFQIWQRALDNLEAHVYNIIIENFDITSGKALKINEAEQIIIGTYASKSKHYKERNANQERALATVSIGLYYAKFKDGTQEFIKLYPFHTFKNFYNYLSLRARGRMNKRIARSESRSREPGFEYNLLVHDLIENNDEHIMIAEAYYPEYEQRCYYQYNPSTGYSERICYDIFTGYRFTHAIVAAFDRQGNVKWDNSFEILDVLTYNLKPQVRYIIERNEILLLYAHRDEIKSKVISENRVIEGKTSIRIPTANPADRVRETIAAGIEHWYDNVFIAYGYQRIRSDNREGRTRRRVFYFYKIEYR